MSLILASGSPRRAELLSWLGLNPEIQPQDIDEQRRPGEAGVDYARRLAREKARAALSRAAAGDWILAADTVVHLNDQVFDKPRDRAQAAGHLRSLSGREHRVTTGCALAAPEEPIQVFHATTRVRFRDLTSQEIAAYLATGEGDDKAGAYGIQGRAGVFVAELHGSWTNVMGLPVELCLDRLGQVGIQP